MDGVDVEGEPVAAPRGRRRRLLILGVAGVVLATGAAVAASESRRPAQSAVVLAETTTTRTAPEPPPTAPPTTAAPATTATTAPPVTAAPDPPPAPAPAPPAPPLSFAARLEQAMAGTPGCLVVEQDGILTYEHNPTTSMVPASAQKLMVGAAVLARLGPDFAFETRVVAPAPPDETGRLHDAWLVGGGDPFLATPDYIAYTQSKPRLATLPLTPLAALADRLAAAGVRDIPAGLQADESRYDTARSVPTWKPSYVREAEVGSIGALTVNEGLASWGRDQVVSPDPAAATTAALTQMLSERGVAAAPPPAAGEVRTAPPGAVVVASVRSAPLSDIVAAMMRASDNYAAEMLLRELDRQTGGSGTTAGGAARTVAEMADAGVAVEGVHLNDGSGLDTGNRSTCRALLGALRLASRPDLSAVAHGLAVAGRSGTLVNRFLGTPVEGRLAAKTGWLSGAAALVGRIDGGRPVRFALMVNGSFNYATAKALQDRVVEVLAAAPAPQ